jgi:hypothetical protein
MRCPNTEAPCRLNCGSACAFAASTPEERAEIVRGIRSLRTFDLGPGPAIDTAALTAARTIVRTAYHAVQRLPQGDPSIRVLATELDELCVGLSAEIESAEPRLPFAVAAE